MRFDGVSIVAPGFLEDPVVDRFDRAIGGHQVLERECKAHATLGAAPLHDRLEPGGLGRCEQGFELGDRLGRLGHADLGCQRLIVEDAGHAVVETHGIKRAGTSDPVCIQPVLVELWHRPIIPAERRRVVVQDFSGGRPVRKRPSLATGSGRADCHSREASASW